MIVSTIMLLSACSKLENVDDRLSLEEQIQNLLLQNQINVGTIIDYDVKANHVFVIYQSEKYLRPIEVAVLKMDYDSIKWVTGYKDFLYEGSSTHCQKNSLCVTLIRESNPNIKDVKMFGKTAKLVKSSIELTDGYTEEVKYWIIYSTYDEYNNAISNDVEYVMK
ncbi:hypothetical protein ACSVDA_00490 [Cytobacillus sp. Hm23]